MAKFGIGASVSVAARGEGRGEKTSGYRVAIGARAWVSIFAGEGDSGTLSPFTGIVFRAEFIVVAAEGVGHKETTDNRITNVMGAEFVVRTLLQDSHAGASFT